MRFVDTPAMCLQIVDRVLIVQWHENEHDDDDNVNQHIESSYRECERLVLEHDVKSAIVDLSTMSNGFMFMNLPRIVSCVIENDTFIRNVPKVFIIGMYAFQFMPISPKVRFCDSINIACHCLKIDADLIL